MSAIRILLVDDHPLFRQGVAYTLSREPDFLQLPAIASRSTPRPASQAAARLWTDDYSNLLQIIR